MDKDKIAQMQDTLAGMKTKAEGVKSGLVDVGKTTSHSTQQSVLDVLTKKMLGDGGAVSSADTGIDKFLRETKASAEALRESSASRIEMEAEEQAGLISKAGEQRLTSAQERRGAMGFNPAALKAIQDSTKQQLADLDKRKDQALLENNTALHDKYTNLQLKAYEFQQKAEQQQFSNMLGIGRLVADIGKEERMESQFTQNLNLQKEQLERNKQSDMADIYLEYGLTPQEGDTLGDVVKRAQPKADAKRRAELAKLLKNTEETEVEVNLSSRIEEFMTVPDEDGNVMTASEAAEMAVAYMEGLGLKATVSDLTRFQIQAVNIQARLDAEAKQREAEQKLKVAEVEKSATFWEDVGGYFDSQKAKDKTGQTQNFSEWLSEASEIKTPVDSAAKFFSNIFSTE